MVHMTRNPHTGKWEDITGKIYNRKSKKWEFPQQMSILPIKLPTIITQPNLNSDPCIDEIDQKTDDTSGMMKIILIGVVIGVILGIIK